MANIVLCRWEPLKIKLELVCTDALIATAIRLTVDDGSEKFRANLRSDEQFPIPAELLNDDKTRLLTKAEFDKKLTELGDAIKAATQTLEREAKIAALQAVRRARAMAAEALATRRITYDGAAQENIGFFGLTKTVAGAFRIDITISLDALLSDEPSLVIFETAAIIAGEIEAGGQHHQIALGLMVRIDRQAVASLIPSLDIPALAFPRLPKLDFTWPEINFPFALHGVELPGFSRLLRLDLPKFDLPDTKLPLTIQWDPGGEPKFTVQISDGRLKIDTSTPGKGMLLVNYNNKELTIAGISGFSFSLVDDKPKFAGTITAKTLEETIYDDTFKIDKMAVPILFRHDKINATVKLKLDGAYDFTNPGGTNFAIRIIINLPQLEIEVRNDPRIFLTLWLIYEIAFDGAKYSGHLTKLEIVKPFPVELVKLAAEKAIAGVVRFLAVIDTTIQGIGQLLDRLAEFAAVLIQYAASGAGAAGGALLDIGEAMADFLGRIFALIKTGSRYVALDIRLDASSYKLLQVWVSPLPDLNPKDAYNLETLGFHLRIAKTWRPSLVIDVSQPRIVTALVIETAAKAGNDDLVLSTDLWYERPGAPTEAVREINTDNATAPAAKPLIELSAHTPAASLIALVAFEAGHFSFFRKLVDAKEEETYEIDGKSHTLSLLRGHPRFADLSIASDGVADVIVALKLDENADKRLLPFLLGSPAEDSPAADDSPFDGLGQYIKIKKPAEGFGKSPVANGKATIPFLVEVALADFKTEARLLLEFDLKTFKASLSGPGSVAIKGTEATKKLLGLDARIVQNPANAKLSQCAPVDGQFEQFVLDFRGGGIRLALSKCARLELWYRRLASEGRGLVFKVSDFAIGRSGIDLEATADPDVPVTLAGIEVPFRFTEGGVSIKNGRLNSFAITGKGQLPPRLIGEANLTASIAFGRKDGRLTFQSADVKLDKSADPIVSKTTRFTFTMQKIELFGRDFDADGIHFWFALTGSARSTGLPGGLAKNLADLEIVGDKFPLTTNGRILSRYLDFNVAVRMKRAINFFNIFKFELRSFGFYPSVARFGDEPAIAISGQMNFASAGDVVSPKIDFHRMWIAPPKKGSALPQVAFDGLGVELKLGGAKLEATAITVDGQLPSLAKDPALAYPDDITVQGFLASGRLKIDGWAPMAAAMGFLEIERASREIRHSFFAFGQAEELSIEIPTPIGMFYLREVGFGFGFRYTFAGLVAADQVKSPNQLVKILDDVAKRQGDLARFAAWAPEPEGNRLTLAMRALITVASASGKNKLSEAERYLSNVLMFDVAAAIRSDLTFLMTARGWINTNYYAFVKGELKDGSKDVALAREAIRTNPPLTGYVYISVPRKQFLGRLVADGKGYIGKTPEIHPIVRKMLTGISWSATLFIQPGLFHFEMGWPYELKLKFAEEGKVYAAAIDLEGGFVFRIEDAAMLYGVAFRGAGFAQFGGSVGSDSFGASAVARTDFRIDGKFIAYIPMLDPKDTLFYGAISFSNTLSLRIAVWLRIKIFGKKISFELSISFSRTVTIALELAISPREIGGRGAASVAFSAFGRTLRIGVALGFNTGALERARVKVERFLTIGLDAVTPDPAKGLAPPPPPAAPALSAQIVDGAVKKEDEKQTLIEAIKAEKIGQPSFWAMLFEIPEEHLPPGTDRQYLMTLIPRDETEVEHLPMPAGTFFAPPPRDHQSAGLVDYRLDLAGIAVDFKQVMDTSTVPVTDLHDIRAHYQSRVAGTEQEPLPLWDFIHDCFLATALVNGKEVKASDDDITTSAILKQPQRLKISSLRARLPEDSTLATEKLRNAALDQLPEKPQPASPPDKSEPDDVAISDYQREVEERRSTVIAAIGDSATTLALAASYDSHGTWHFPPRALTGIDARDFGLTFIADEKAIDALFDLAAPNTPRPASFKIQARIDKDDLEPTAAAPVHLLNPPERFFRNAKPAFAGLTAAATRDGIALDWDLEPAWGISVGAYHDPEFLLRHYLIKREVYYGTTKAIVFKNREFNTKACAPIARKVIKTVDQKEPEEELRELGYEVIRPLAQIVDDLIDLPNDFREAFLKSGEDPRRAWLQAKKMAGGEQIELRYTIVPVDIAGSEGTPEVRKVLLAEPEKRLVPLIKAELIFRHTGLGDIAKPSADLELFLRIDDTMARARKREGEDPQRLPGEGTVYELKFRREPTVAGGIYGIDALSQARERPTGTEFTPTTDMDTVIEVTLTNRSTVLEDDKLGVSRPFHPSERFQPLVIATSAPVEVPIRGTAFFKVTKGDLKSLKARLAGSASEPSTFRVAVRRIRFSTDGVEGPPEKEFGSSGGIEYQSGWLPADLALMIFSEKVTPGLDPVIAETVIETYEHPRHADFDALDFDDMRGEAGRLAVLHPDPDGELGDTGPGNAIEFRFHRLADTRRRTATRLAWNSRPVIERGRRKSPVADPRTHAKLMGGFDIFETDLAEVNDESRLADHARRVARAQRLPDDQRGLDPSEIGDFEKVEALYQSETIRRIYSRAKQRDDERPPWFSTAETLLVWPETGWRRFLVPAPIEAELMPLFDRGYPQTITISFKPDPATTDKWAFAKETGMQFKSGGKKAGPDMKLPPPQGSSWTPSTLTSFLRNLVWTAEKKDKVKDAFQESRDYFRAVPLLIKAHRENFDPEVTIHVDLTGELHPLLADVIDIVRWHEEKDRLPYRRYEPVLEGAPPTRAKTLRQFMDETPAERDPYGWAVLRTLGLATGLRLFDMETFTYLGTAQTLTRLNAAMRRALREYSPSDIDVGRPQVDILLRHDGLHSLHSFDAAIDAEIAEGKAGTLIDEEGLALVQIALRPMPEALSDQKDKADQCTGYARISFSGEGKKSIILTPTEKNALYEVINVAGGLAGGAPRYFALGGDQNKAAMVLVPEGATLDKSNIISIDGLPAGTAALIRITAIGTTSLQTAFDGLDLSSDGKNQLSREFVAGPAALDYASVGPESGPEAHERFARLSGYALDLLICGAVPDNIQEHKATQKGFHRFADLVEQRFEKIAVPDPSPWISDATMREKRNDWRNLLSDIASFTARFATHCAGRRPAHKPSDEAWLPYSLAAVVRQDPLRVAPRADGVMDILLIHQDAWARRRRYVVRPFGRYENLWSAKLSAAQERETLPTLRDIIDIEYDKKSPYLTDPGFHRRSIDITLPRSHPLLPPAILAARRIDLKDKNDTRVPGHAMEFVLARHPEEILSEANRQVADGYQFDHVGLTFFREFSAPRWARGIDPNVELVPELGADAGSRPPLRSLSFTDASFAEQHALDGELLPPIDGGLLPQQLADGWRGIAAVRTTGIPHFYRLHAVAHAAAGVVVSDPAAATIPEGRPAPRLPWQQPVAKGGYPPSHWATVAPIWTVVDNGAMPVTVTVTVPLLRNYDSLPKDECDLWMPSWQQPATHLEPVFRLPDVSASYTLAIVASGEPDSAGVELSLSRSTEAELLPLPPDKAIAVSSYSVLMAGPHFEHQFTNEYFAGTEQTKPPRLCPKPAGEDWHITLPLKRRPSAPASAVDTPARFELPEEANALLDDLTISDTQWGGWRLVAPRRHARVTLTRPAGTLDPDNTNPGPRIDWREFNQVMAALVALYGDYAEDGHEIVAKLEPFAVPLEGYLADRRWVERAGDRLTFEIDGISILAGFAPPADGAAPYFAISARLSAWDMPALPQDRGIEARHALTVALSGPARANPPLRQHVLTPLRSQMAHSVLAGSVLVDAAGRDGYMPVSRRCEADLEPGGAGQAGYDFGRFLAPFEFTRQLRLTSKEDATWTQDKQTALIAVIKILETGNLPGSGRALTALEAIASSVALDPAQRPDVELILPQTVARQAELEIVRLALALTGAEPGYWSKPTALTLRYPPSDKQLADVDYDGAFASSPRAKSALLALARDQILGPGRSLQVILHRTGAFPLTDFIKRAIDG